jgi:hypothetical protein
MEDFLFASYRGTSQALCRGIVKPKHLDHGLYYFGCARALLDAPFVPEEEAELACLLDDGRGDPDRLRQLHETLLAAVRRAEDAGRAAWRPLRGRNTYAQLNELLERNGHQPVAMDVNDPYDAEAVFRHCNLRADLTVIRYVPDMQAWMLR